MYLLHGIHARMMSECAPTVTHTFGMFLRRRNKMKKAFSIFSIPWLVTGIGFGIGAIILVTQISESDISVFESLEPVVCLIGAIVAIFISIWIKEKEKDNVSNKK